MRDLERLNKFYSQLCEMHKETFSDIRFGQLMHNFTEWLLTAKREDIFFLEENDFLSLFREYAIKNERYSKETPWKK